jgi:hypothetical protein
MASALGNNNFVQTFQNYAMQQMAQNARMSQSQGSGSQYNQSAPSKDTSGNLVEVDPFVPTPDLGWLAHGQICEDAARNVGFKGRIVSRQMGSDDPADIKQRQQGVATMNNADPKQTKQQFLHGFDQVNISSEASLLKSTTGQLQDLKKAGTNHSAVNISMGSSKASLSTDRIQQAADAFAASHQTGHLNALASNYAKAFNVDTDKLMGDDKKASAKEWAKLDQGIINRVNSGLNGSSEVKQAKGNYDEAVQSMDPLKNSVVVAGEESGQVQGLARAEHLQLPKDFYDNALSDKDNITVSAAGSQKHPHSTNASAYVNRSSNTAVFADGQQDGYQGTSFAAPRVAAMAATLQKQHPEMSNAEVRQQIQQMTVQGNDQGRPISVLTDSNIRKSM